MFAPCVFRSPSFTKALSYCNVQLQVLRCPLVMCVSCPLLCLVGLLCLTGLSAFTTEEQALLQFAEQISNFDVSYQRSLKQAAITSTVCMHASYSFWPELYAPSDKSTNIICAQDFCCISAGVQDQPMARVGQGQQHSVPLR